MTTTKTSHFLLLSTLPKDRATKLLQAMEKQYDAGQQAALDRQDARS